MYKKLCVYFREQGRPLFMEKTSIGLLLLDSMFPIWQDDGL